MTSTAHTTTDAITDLSAGELSQAIHQGTLSCRAVMAAYLERIHTLNPALNALVMLRDDDVLMAEAGTCDAELAAGTSRGWMHGMPQAIKDTAHVAGLPTTLGCTLLRHSVAKADSIIVERVKAAGALIVGKTNVPEFAMGSHTFNPIFGVTPNAYDPTRSAGGSSGGGAVALAHRLLPVADGSDFMGSLRNPAAWNNCFGMRPSQGLVPFAPGPDVWLSQLGTEGPMARNVADLARLLYTQAGDDPRQPLSWSPSGSKSVGLRELRGLRVGWLGDLGGHLATEAGVLQACESGLERLRSNGAVVTPVQLNIDLDAVWQCWLAWRRALVGPRVGALMGMAGARDAIKPESLWEYDQSVVMDMATFMQASETRTRLYNRMTALFETVDVLAMPVTQTWPFPIEQRWPQNIEGRRMDTYHRWMESTIYATLTGLPAISVPAGFDATGRWPMGLQLIGQRRGDAELLSVAAAYESHIGDWLSVRPTPPQLGRAPVPLPV